jgi:hypothetical protein
VDQAAMNRKAKALASVVITRRDLTAPTNKAKPFNHPDWIWELKHDGYRALLIKDGERISLQTRKGNELLPFFPEIAADLRKLPDLVMDGELVMLDATGKTGGMSRQHAAGVLSVDFLTFQTPIRMRWIEFLRSCQVFCKVLRRQMLNAYRFNSL